MFPPCRNGKDGRLYKLYYTEAALSLTDETALLSCLGEDRRAQIAERTPEDRICSAAASCLLRYALYDTGYGAFADAPIAWEGKPHFANPDIPLYFNLSHTADKKRGGFAAAVLLSDADEVGVDVEFVHPIHNRDALMRRLFTQREREYVEKSGEERAFFDIWCAKEALIKRTGEGFSRPLSSVSVDVSARRITADGIVCDFVRMYIGQACICCAADALSHGVTLCTVAVNDIINLQNGEASWKK